MIQLFESGRLASSEEVFAQYVRALARADRLNGTALMQTLYRGAQSYMGAAAPAAAAHMAPVMAPAAAAPSFAAQPAMGLAGLAGGSAAAEGGAAAGAALGSAKNPIYMMQARRCGWVGQRGCNSVHASAAPAACRDCMHQLRHAACLRASCACTAAAWHAAPALWWHLLQSLPWARGR